jgi:AraC-like DNA-binding protein
MGHLAFAVRQDTCSADVIRRIVATAERSGIDRSDLLRASRLDASAFRDPKGRVGVAHLGALWDQGSRWRRDLPIRVAEELRLDDLGPFTFMLKTAPTAFDAMRLAIDYYPLINDGGTWELRERDGEVEVRWMNLTGARRGVAEGSESIIAHFVRGAREVQREPLALTTIRFTHGARTSVRALEAHFGCRVEHDAPVNSITMPRAQLDGPAVMSNPAMHAFFLPLVERDLEPLRGRKTTARFARREIARRLADGPPSAETIAAALAITERTLRRRLEAEGTSYRALVDDIRRDELHPLVTDRSKSITRIAHELGFSDSSAFARACRRWFGASPSELRARPK